MTTIECSNENDFESCFKIKGTYTVRDGVYDVDGDIIIKKIVEILPFKFSTVTGSFDCSCNSLRSLKGAPKEVGGDFLCNDNKLTSLEGAPVKVGGDFDCSNNNLRSLKGAPKKVKGSFWCSYNKLYSLEGATTKVGGDFWCDKNKLSSLEGVPKEVGGDFNCEYSTVLFTTEEIEAISMVGGTILNDF